MRKGGLLHGQHHVGALGHCKSAGSALGLERGVVEVT